MVTFMCYVPEEPLAIASNRTGVGKNGEIMQIFDERSLHLGLIEDRHIVTVKANRKSHLIFNQLISIVASFSDLE